MDKFLASEKGTDCQGDITLHENIQVYLDLQKILENFTNQLFLSLFKSPRIQLISAVNDWDPLRCPEQNSPSVYSDRPYSCGRSNWAFSLRIIRWIFFFFYLLNAFSNQYNNLKINL